MNLEKNDATSRSAGTSHETIFEPSGKGKAAPRELVLQMGELETRPMHSLKVRSFLLWCLCNQSMLTGMQGFKGPDRNPRCPTTVCRSHLRWGEGNHPSPQLVQLLRYRQGSNGSSHYKSIGSCSSRFSRRRGYEEAQGFASSLCPTPPRCCLARAHANRGRTRLEDGQVSFVSGCMA